MPNKYIVYYEEVIAKLEKTIEALNTRIAKAESMGADKEDNKWHKSYLDLKENLVRQNTYLEDYKKSLELKLKEYGTKRPNEQKEKTTEELAKQVGLI